MKGIISPFEYSIRKTPFVGFCNHTLALKETFSALTLPLAEKTPRRTIIKLTIVVYSEDASATMAKKIRDAQWRITT